MISRCGTFAFIAAAIGGSVLILVMIVLMLMFCIYRMRKKDEGSYSLDEPRQTFNYTRAKDQEFFAWSLRRIRCRSFCIDWLLALIVSVTDMACVPAGPTFSPFVWRLRQLVPGPRRHMFYSVVNTTLSVSVSALGQNTAAASSVLILHCWNYKSCWPLLLVV